jgi:hypothetical protein
LGCNEISLHSKRKSSRKISRITPADGQEVEAQEEKGGEPPGEPLTGNEEIVRCEGGGIVVGMLDIVQSCALCEVSVYLEEEVPERHVIESFEPF